ncbi:MAG TPA: site-2 protease family protein [Opitutaceae bacterium]|nr:site-2 protease family protein [Opitutaceae bacterium]
MQSSVTEGLLWYLVFVLSTSCHEAAHAWSALKLGDDTAARGGQVSLNPWPHVRREPFGMVVVPLLAWFSAGWMVGWASAPYDPTWARQWPRRAALMALAGPAANLLLVLGAALLIRVGVEWNVLTAPASLGSMHLADAVNAGPWDIVAMILSVTLSLNLLLCVFNLLPFPPLDGSSVPLLLLPPEMAEKYNTALRNPMLQIVGLIVASRLLGPLFPKLLLTAGQILFPSIRYT